MPPVLLDTDILSAILRGRSEMAMTHARGYLAVHGRFAFSVITRYEILRGLKAKRATAQLGRFEEFCRACDVLPLTDDIVVRAADIYADLHRRGALIGDADTLIAATALEQGRALVTHNSDHFSRVNGLSIESWLIP